MVGDSTNLDTRTVVERTGVSVRQLNHWDRLGIVGPSLQPAIGSGSRRRYAANDILLILAAGEMRGLGVSLEATRKAIAAIRHAGVGLDNAKGVTLVGDCTGVLYVGADRARVLESAHQTEVAYLLNLERIAQRAVAATSDVPAPSSELHTLADSIEQVILRPERGCFSARCNAYSGLTGHGASVADAVAALREAVSRATAAQRVDVEKDVEKRVRKRSQPVATGGGAATWGAGW